MFIRFKCKFSFLRQNFETPGLGSERDQKGRSRLGNSLLGPKSTYSPKVVEIDGPGLLTSHPQTSFLKGHRTEFFFLRREVEFG